jgi:hypothetical protein
MKRLLPLSGFVSCASLLLVALTFAGQLVTLWRHPFVPLHDLPNHAARHYLEYLALSGQPLPAGYAIEFRILPNLGADLIVPPLMCLFPPLIACKVFLSLAVAIYWLGPALFILQQGGRRPEAFFAALLLLPWVFSQAFFWGFLNYYLGVGLLFLTLTHLCWLGRRETLRPLDLVLHAGLITLLFFCHQIPWMAYGVCMACWLIGDMWKTISASRQFLCRAGMVALAALPSLVLFDIFFCESPPLPKGEEATWVGWSDKYWTAAREFRAYDNTVDVAAACLWLVAVAAAWGSGLFRRGQWSWLHLCLAVLGLVFLLAPTAYAGGADPDARVLPPILIIFLAMMGRLPGRHLKLATGLLAACIVLHYSSIYQNWGKISDRLDGQAECLAHIEPNTRVGEMIKVYDRSYKTAEYHFCCWAVPLRGAFVPSVWAFPEPMPLRILDERGVGYPDYRDVGYPDYMWVYNPDGHDLKREKNELGAYREICSSGAMSLWKVGKPRSPP